MGVCDDPNYFYSYIDGLLNGMGVDHASLGWATQKSKMLANSLSRLVHGNTELVIM